MARDDLRDSKSTHRLAMRMRRRAIPAAERSRLSGLVEEWLLALLALLDPQTVMLFASFGSEVDTSGMLRALDRQGRRIALPVVAGREMRAVAFRPGDSVRRTPSGADEPAAGAEVPPAAIDVVVVPGLVFDVSGYRIGSGGGAYDRFLRRLRADALRVGIALHVQVVADVPHGPADEPVDLVATDTDAVRCRPDRLAGRLSPSSLLFAAAARVVGRGPVTRATGYPAAAPLGGSGGRA